MDLGGGSKTAFFMAVLNLMVFAIRCQLPDKEHDQNHIPSPAPWPRYEEHSEIPWYIAKNSGHTAGYGGDGGNIFSSARGEGVYIKHMWVCWHEVVWGIKIAYTSGDHFEAGTLIGYVEQNAATFTFELSETLQMVTLYEGQCSSRICSCGFEIITNLQTVMFGPDKGSCLAHPIVFDDGAKLAGVLGRSGDFLDMLAFAYTFPTADITVDDWITQALEKDVTVQSDTDPSMPVE